MSGDIKKQASEDHDYQIAVGIVLGVLFSLLGFFGSFIGNYVWWNYVQKFPDRVHIVGLIAILVFFSSILFLIYLSIKIYKRT